MRYLLLALALSLTSHAATWQECRGLEKHGKDATACYTQLTHTSDPALRAEGFWGLENYQQANAEFRDAVASPSSGAAVRVRWGLLFHERFNNPEAVNLFNEALAKDPNYAPAFYGLALVSADGFDGRAPQYIAKALTLDPKSAESRELAADMAFENSDFDTAIKEADQAIALAPDALDAMAIHAALELLNDRSPDAWLAKITAINPKYGEGYARIGYHMVQNRRYADGVSYYRKAVEVQPRLWSAHAQLGINLMRLGQQDEPEKELQLAYDNGYRDAATVNSLRLLDSYKNFQTFTDDTTILKLNKKEAELLQPYFSAELHRAMAAYEKKYQMKLKGPVQLEVYPDHEDFAVRTMGMPGLGALGVTFGQVVAMDSPSGRKPGEFHWASTLRHELSHVYVLSATNHRVPRWFTEGLAVHEETQASPEWGDRVTPEILIAIRDKKLLPVAELDRGFIYPQYPAQVIVSYFQGGSICDYIGERWGEGKLLEIVHAYAKLTPTPEVIQTTLGVSAEQFDKDYMTWLDKQLGEVVRNFDPWRKQLTELAQHAKSKDYAFVLANGEKVKALYPQYIGDANAYQMIADAQLAGGNKQAAAKVLVEYEKMGGHEPATLKQLATLEAEAGDKAAAAATLDRLNYVYPTGDEELHRRLGTLFLDLKSYDGAVREYSAVVALHPIDVAGAQYNLAQAYMAKGDRAKAEEAVLAALEAAPGYRPAQTLLLQLHNGGAPAQPKTN
ncbi:MAG: tetratricopeptide repeat protein [Acidobacteriaceae bacterium]|nr:tetratricopeptide repeat protein [Acidobacteriaceae bacterium]